MGKANNKLNSIDGGTSVISGGMLVPLPIPDKERIYYEVLSYNPEIPDSTRVDDLFLDDEELLEQKGNTLRVASNDLHTTDLIYKLAPKIGFQKAFDIGYKIQEKYKDKYHLNDDGTRNARFGNMFTKLNNLFSRNIRFRHNYPNYVIKNAIFGKYNNHPRFYALGGEDSLVKQSPLIYNRETGNAYAEQKLNNTNNKTYRVDLSGLKTTGGRHYNNKYVQYIYNGLGKYGYSEEQKAAILANIIEESGGNPFAIDSTKKFKGLLQWAEDRYVPDTTNDVYKEIDNQLDYIYKTSNNLDDKVSWTHGGEGSGYQSRTNAHDDWAKANDLDTIMRGYTLGYVRPTGKVESYNNRNKVARQLLDRFNAKQEIKEFKYWDPNNYTMWNPNKEFKFGGKDKMINLKQIGISNGLIQTSPSTGKHPQRKLTGGDYNLIGAGINLLGSGIGYLIDRNAYKNLEEYQNPIAQGHIKLKGYNPSAELTNVDTEFSKLYRGLNNNTASSQAAINRNRLYRAMQLGEKGKILNYAENANNEIQNNETLQNAQIDANNIMMQNRTNEANTQLRNQRKLDLADAASKAISGVGASIGDFVQNQFRAEDSYNNFIANALDALKVLSEEEQQKVLDNISFSNPSRITLFNRKKNKI